jgi:hypothetical protein
MHRFARQEGLGRPHPLPLPNPRWSPPILTCDSWPLQVSLPVPGGGAVLEAVEPSVAGAWPLGRSRD